MRRPILLFAVLSLSLPASAALEQAFTAAQAAFDSALSAPSLVPAFKPAALDDEDSLIALLSDRDPSVRASAAKSLRGFAWQSQKSEDALLSRAQDQNELESVRREAIKSLAVAAQHWTTRDDLIRLAQDDSESLALRAVTLKSLYAAAGVDPQARQALLDALDGQGPAALRGAAAWGLFEAAPADQASREKLLELAGDASEAAALRVEALKSLFSAMTDWDVKDAVLKLAQDQGGAPAAARQAAMLALSAVNQDWAVQEYLRQEASSEPDAALRAAAIRALSRGTDLDLARYFHLAYYYGSVLDPLEDQ